MIFFLDTADLKEIREAQETGLLDGITTNPSHIAKANTNFLQLQEEMNETYKPKLIRYVRLHAEFQNPDNLSELLEILKSAAKQKELVLAYWPQFLMPAFCY